jgi:AcrR family transcriptional regulator
VTATETKRRYDNTLRRERANETRERIVASGAELVRQTSVRDWRGVTMRAVAERARVNERTVYRHFANERALRDAVMHRLEQEVGIDFTQLRLDDVGAAAARILRLVAASPLDRPRPPLDPTLAEAKQRQHEALIGAVASHAEEWPDADGTLVAALLDVLWGVSSYERLVRDWDLESEEAIRGLTWVISLVDDAIRRGERPPRLKRGRR